MTRPATSPRVSRRPGRPSTTWRPGSRPHRWPSLKPGRSATLTLKVRVSKSLAGNIGHSTASVTGGDLRAKDTGSTAIVRKVGKVEQGF